MTAARNPQPSGHVGRRTSDYLRLDDLPIEQMGSEPPAEAGHSFVLPASTAREFAEVRDNLDALAHLVGAGAVETTRRLVADLHERTARNEGRLRGTARELAAARHHLTTAISEREHARGVACRLEEEIARDRGGEWLATYVAMLEQHAGPDAIDVITGRANAQVANAVAARFVEETIDPVALRQDTGLPVIDDATLGERELVFRRDGVTVAVGRIDRLFRPLDTANEIALGATQADGPPGGETVDVFAAMGGEGFVLPDGFRLDFAGGDPAGTRMLTWPDGSCWLSAGDGRWALESTLQEDARVLVSPPASDRAVGARAVKVGETWGPYPSPPGAAEEFPMPHPAGPVDPPKPPHHQPFA